MFLKRVERRSAASMVRTARDSEPAADCPRARLQRLEPRVALDLSMRFEGLFHASEFPGHQSETALAIHQSHPNHLFVSSNFGAFREVDQGPNAPIAES